MQELWDTVIYLIKKTMGKAGVQASDICAMGITTQRNTLILWDKCVDQTSFFCVRL
jgi:glycerol kinase